MNNPNTLVALAYIKTNDNPLLVFCNDILYLLITAPDKTLRNDEILEKLEYEFGLEMKQSTINNCISILKKQGEIKCLPNGAGYTIEKTDFDVNEFDENMRRLHAQEDAVVEALMKFVNEKYKLSWDVAKAKDNLSFFLNEQGNAARLFMNEKLKDEDSKIGGSWYVGRFIDYIQGSERVEKEYLEDINNGLMIYQGIYQTNNYQQDKRQKFKGTVFYFDTKMILRLTGYSVQMHVRATRELAQLITEDYGGKIGIFNKTVEEVRNALYTAGRCYENKKPIMNRELAIFAEGHPVEASSLLEISYCIDDLLKKYGVVREPEVAWESEKNHKYWLDKSDIENYIKQECHWREGTIHNDVKVINQINILREGDYSVRYGGLKKRPVFVTTNSGLVYNFKKYIEQTIEKDGQSYLNPHALPVISESMLLTRLWTPYAKKYSDLPALTLARQAYAAQNPGTRYFEELRNVALEYKQMNNVDILNIDEVKKRQLEDILIAKTEGEVKALTVEMVASSVEELVQMQVFSLKEEVAASKEMVELKDARLSEAEESIIRLAAKPFINKLGWRRLIIWAAEYWWALATLALQILAFFICKPLDSILPHFVALLPFVMEATLAVLDKYFEKKEWHYYILCCAVKYVCKWYTTEILKGVQQEKRWYWDYIVSKCLEETPILNKHKAWCEYEGHLSDAEKEELNEDSQELCEMPLAECCITLSEQNNKIP